MAYGWNTKKTEAGFAWAVTATTWSEEAGRAISTTLVSGTAPTRARAAAQAKRHVLTYRRGKAA